MEVSIYRIATDSELEFAELLLARKTALDRDVPSGTFLDISPLSSLKLLDDGMNHSAALPSFHSLSIRKGHK